MPASNFLVGFLMLTGLTAARAAAVTKIAANGSAEYDCKEHCGFSGPWGFSWMAKGDEIISTDGTSLVTTTVAEQA